MTPRRFDLAVKWRLFRHFETGGDADAARVYRWHIEKRSGARMQAGLATDVWKRSLDDYVSSAEALHAAMVREGFDARHAIPLDVDGELLDGSHRLACALALGAAEVPVVRRPQRVWAPAWDRAWFVSHGMGKEDLERLSRDYAALAVSA